MLQLQRTLLLLTAQRVQTSELRSLPCFLSIPAHVVKLKVIARRPCIVLPEELPMSLAPFALRPSPLAPGTWIVHHHCRCDPTLQTCITSSRGLRSLSRPWMTRWHPARSIPWHGAIFKGPGRFLLGLPRRTGVASPSPDWRTRNLRSSSTLKRGAARYQPDLSGRTPQREGAALHQRWGLNEGPYSRSPAAVVPTWRSLPRHTAMARDYRPVISDSPGLAMLTLA